MMGFRLTSTFAVANLVKAWRVRAFLMRSTQQLGRAPRTSTLWLSFAAESIALIDVGMRRVAVAVSDKVNIR